MKSYGPGLLLMNSSSSIILLYGSNNIKKSIFPSAAVCKVGLVSDYLVIHPVIYKLLAHSSVQREKWSIKKHTALCADCLDSFKRGKKMLHLTFFPRGAIETVSEAELGDADTYVNLLLLSASANSHGGDLWTPLSPIATSHQRSLPPCVNASLISHPTPSAASPPIWHWWLCGERPNMQFTPLHILTTFADADWSTQVIKRDAGGSSHNKNRRTVTFKALMAIMS